MTAGQDAPLLLSRMCYSMNQGIGLRRVAHDTMRDYYENDEDSGLEVPIRYLLEDLVDRWQAVAADRGVDLVTSLPPSGDAMVDVEMVRRLVDNLVDNALRHVPVGGVVRVTAQVRDDLWTLAVDDSGPGVPGELHGRLFERFSRGDRSRARGTGGAGLGLALCAVIARLHGGDIRLDAAHPSRFVVELPRSGASA